MPRALVKGGIVDLEYNEVVWDRPVPMRILFSDMTGYHIGATDGTLGALDDVLIDDRFWSVRYFVARTRRWFPARTVLISPGGVHRPVPKHQILPVEYTCEEVKNAPALQTDAPISVQHERDLASYYGWSAPLMAGIGDPALVGGVAELHVETIRKAQEQSTTDLHLRSVNHLIGYDVETADGEYGQVLDLLLNPNNWSVNLVLILPPDAAETDAPVPLSPAWIRWVSYEDKTIRVELHNDELAGTPRFKRADFTNYQFERSLFEHYSACRTRR